MSLNSCPLAGNDEAMKPVETDATHTLCCGGQEATGKCLWAPLRTIDISVTGVMFASKPDALSQYRELFEEEDLPHVVYPPHHVAGHGEEGASFARKQERLAVTEVSMAIVCQGRRKEDDL